MYSIIMGFPSPAESYTDTAIDFNRHIIEHPAASFYFYVRGDSLSGLHIAEGDLVVADRSLSPVSGDIIIGTLEGSFVLKRYEIKNGRHWLVPANTLYDPVEITAETDFQCWGVAVSLVRKLPRGGVP